MIVLRLFTCLPLLLLVSCGGKTAAPPAAARPQNLLLITLDTTRADHLGSYGAGFARTPHLDALAQRGVRFDQAIAPVPLTRPSHASILTGLLPHRHGVWSNGPYRLDPQWTTLAQRFRDSGFRTGAVIASFVLTRSFGFENGFEMYDDRLQDAPGADPEKTATDVAASAAGWLNGNVQPPFFLWVHFYDPHFPYTPPDPYRAQFAGRPYDGEIAFVDRAVGDIVQVLKNKNWLEHTLVIAAGDHGEALGEHGETTHGFYLYESTMKVPLLIAGPGVHAGTVIPGTVGLTDLMPTVLDAFQLRKDTDRFDGRSFWSGLQSGRIDSRAVLMENRSLHYQFGWAAPAAVRTDQWKWIDAPEPELYNLKSDPGETSNRAGAEKQRATEMQALRKKLTPQETVSSAASGLSPEEEEKLESLGYVTGGSTSTTDVYAGPDPKRFSPVVASIERLIHARQLKNTEDSEALSREILQKDPSNLFALRTRGEILIEQRRYAEALAVLISISGPNENHPETLAHLALAYEKTGKPQEAMQWYEKATTPPWVHWPALESLARMSTRYPELLSRADLLRRLEVFQPASTRERVSLARAYAIAGEYDRAAGWYRKALESDPRMTEALVGLAQMQQKTGRLTEAEQTLLRVAPPTAESLYVLGSVLLAQQEKDRACPMLSEALRRNPGNPNLLFGIGFGLQTCGSIDSAVAAYERSLAAEPNHAEALYNLAQIEEGRGNAGRARDLYRRFLAAAPPRLDTQKAQAKKRLSVLR